MTQPASDQAASARAFYTRCIEESFRQATELSVQTHRSPVDILALPDFDAVLRESRVGSLEAARRIAEMIVVHLDKAQAPGAWWRDLCSYERGYFLQEATTETGPPTNRPRRGVSALSMSFTWDVPAVLRRLESGEPITDDLRRPTTLLFSRAGEGRVRVVEIAGEVERVFRFTNGLRTVAQIATAAGVGEPETKQILEALAQIGAVALAVY